jgi:DNA-binding response OmpR family regulator
MASKKPVILAVDDDVQVLRLIARILTEEGYRVTTASNGIEALSAFDHEHPDLVLLDIAMPRLDGYEVCKSIRETSQVPVIMVTARGSEEERVRGFEVGADDYVTKPYFPKELVARVDAVLRRAVPRTGDSPSVFRCDDLVVDFTRRTVSIGDKLVKLTATEYRLLEYLARNAGCVVTGNEILRHVWSEGYEEDERSSLLRTAMLRLRRKLGDDVKKPRYIFTWPGIGYRMASHAEAPRPS